MSWLFIWGTKIIIGISLHWQFEQLYEFPILTVSFVFLWSFLLYLTSLCRDLDLSLVYKFAAFPKIRKFKLGDNKSADKLLARKGQVWRAPGNICHDKRQNYSLIFCGSGVWNGVNLLNLRFESWIWNIFL